MAKEIRNITNMELTTDLKRTDVVGKAVIKPFGKLVVAQVNSEEIKSSLKDGLLKKMVDNKWIVVGDIIKGDAKPVEKVEKAEAKKIEEKIEAEEKPKKKKKKKKSEE